MMLISRTLLILQGKMISLTFLYSVQHEVSSNIQQERDFHDTTVEGSKYPQIQQNNAYTRENECLPMETIDLERCFKGFIPHFSTAMRNVLTILLHRQAYVLMMSKPIPLSKRRLLSLLKVYIYSITNILKLNMQVTNRVGIT